MFAATPSLPQTPPSPRQRVAKGVSSELLIGALVPPVLLGILISRTLADAMTQAGLVSEQLYRGERLPILNVPTTKSDGDKADGNNPE